MTTPEATRRARASKRRGAQWETDIRNYLRDLGFDTEPLKLSGSADEGDLVVRLGKRYVVIEAKNEATIDLPGYLREAGAEGVNFAAHRPAVSAGQVYPVAIVKARGKGVDEGYAVMQVSEMVRLLADVAAL